MWEIYDYVNSKEQNEIASWTKELQKERRVRLKQKIDMLRRVGLDLPSDVLADIGKHIYKLKVHGNPQLRPLLCRGIVNNDTEFTFLIGAKEIQRDYEPKNAVDTARERHAELLKNPKRRCRHEEID